MKYYTGTIEWDPDYVGADVDGWRVVASVGDPSAEPANAATVGRDARSAEILLYEGTWYVRVLPSFKGGGCGDWRDTDPVEIEVHGREETPPTPTDAAVAFVDATSTARATDEPPLETGVGPYFQEVIVGPDADRGQVVAERHVETQGPLHPDGQRVASPSFPIEAHGAGATMTVLVRNVGAGGRPGTAVSKTVAVPPFLDSDYHAIPIVVVSGSTHTNLRNPTTTDGWEFDATDGLRLLEFPTSDLMDADWTTIGYANEYDGYYVDNAFIESDEIDLGAVMTFRLSSSQTIQRKTATGWFATRGSNFFLSPIKPLQVPSIKDTGLSPRWRGRETSSDGRARRPIRPQDIQVKCIVSTGSGFAHAESDYVSSLDGAMLRGRYVRVALFIREPHGAYQLICPRWTVSAHVFRTMGVGSGTPELNDSAPPGSLKTRTTADVAPLYVKTTGVGDTGWVGLAPVAAALTSIEQSATQRALLPSIGPSTPFLLADNVAYFVYLGRAVGAIVPKYVEFLATTGGSGTQTAEVGLFSTLAPPNKTGQTLTKLVATGTVDSIGTGVKRNTSAFATSVPAGTHLWAGIRASFTVALPTILGIANDLAQGQILSTAAAGALTASATFTGAIVTPALAIGANCPHLTATLD